MKPYLTFRMAIALPVLAFLLIQTSCKKNPAPVYLPNVSTDLIKNETDVTAEAKASIISDGGEPLTESGFCWSSTNQSPTLSDGKTTGGQPLGSFTLTLNGLSPGTTYYVRAFATNSKGTHYGETKTFNTLVKDASGNLYHTVKIGTQTWLLENLKTKKFKNGEAIPYVDIGAWANLSTPAYCWYNADVSYESGLHGALYNWYAVNDAKGLAPAGWRIPTAADWQTLADYLGGAADAGSKLKHSDNSWTAFNGINNLNTSGFAAIPAGYRSYDTGSYGQIGLNAYFWSSGEDVNNGLIYYNRLSYNTNALDMISLQATINGNNAKSMGFSVRCIKE